MPQLRTAVSDAGRLYWTGEFAKLAARLPRLIGEARLASQAAGPDAHSVLAQSYELAASLMVHMGKEDLAAIAGERAITTAVLSNDELLHALRQGTYAWVLLHQGRLAEASPPARRPLRGRSPRHQSTPTISSAGPDVPVVMG